MEQNVHVIDMANWYLGGHPLKATGAGGRTSWASTNSDTGDAWDHFSVTYWYLDDDLASFSSHPLAGSFSDLCVRCMGLKGTDDTFTGGCVTNINDFIASIRSGKPINDAAPVVHSNLAGILGRMAAYGGRQVTWDEMLASK